MTDGTFMKLSAAYLSKYFARKSLAYKKWKITVDGVTHNIDNQQVINLILNSDARSQKLIADSIFHLDEVGIDINVFLKNLIQHSFSSTLSNT
ncbi:MAG: hypothetical protein OQL06_12225 [Gammaproteobacteria bacterium]|nr:hypothetical protein [Gammaproteobacteria bacterium]